MDDEKSRILDIIKLDDGRTPNEAMNDLMNDLQDAPEPTSGELKKFLAQVGVGQVARGQQMFIVAAAQRRPGQLYDIARKLLNDGRMTIEAAERISSSEELNEKIEELTLRIEKLEEKSAPEKSHEGGLTDTGL